MSRHVLTSTVLATCLCVTPAFADGMGSSKSQIELGTDVAVSLNWLKRPPQSLDMTTVSEHFGALQGGFRLGYRYAPLTLGGFFDFGRPLREQDRGFSSGGGFVSFDLSPSWRLGLRFFEQGFSVEKTSTPNYLMHLSGVGAGVDVAWLAKLDDDFALGPYAELDGAGLSRESDASGNGPIDASILRLVVGLRTAIDTRLGYDAAQCDCEKH